MVAPLLAPLLTAAFAALPLPARTSAPRPEAQTSGPIAGKTLVHLGVGLRLTHTQQLDQLRAAQQDPRSPSFRRWLTPEQFGLQFGQPQELVDRTAAWLVAGGFEVTVYPNRTFFEARGTAAQVKALLGVELQGVAGKPSAVHVPDHPAQFPAWLQSQALFVSGLDTRVRFHHRLWDSFGDQALGPQDLRAQYDVAALHAAGFYGQGQKLVVLSYAEAPGNEVQRADVEWFYQNVSDASAPFLENVLPNPEGDYDPEPGGRTEFELDLDMQSVGSPGAESITLEEVPASQVFVLGPQDIANNMPTATAVSVSLGDCEPAEQIQNQSDNEITLMRNAIIQGTMEGQTWSAASGDSGSDDCEIDTPPATVDFPASIPEMIAMGGSEILNPNFNQNIAITSYNTEQVWNDSGQGFGGGGGGGGISQIFQEPAYQSGFGFNGRGVPDLSLIAGLPTTIATVNQPGELDPLEGTSVASPLSAGFFGVIASALGCRLGDVHATLYALGAAQQDGGVKVFNDITVGNNSIDSVPGYDAGKGYDLASGWGSMDVAALARAFPACPVTDAGPVEVDAGLAYSQCSFINCTTNCYTLPDGPSSCAFQSCNPATDAGQCTLGDICSTAGPYAEDGDAGACEYGCNSNADCVDGGQCQACYGVCAPLGSATAQIGDPCVLPTDCATGGICLAFLGIYDGGYCSAPCQPFGPSPAACDCPQGSTCNFLGQGEGACLGNCPADGGACSRAGYVCQPQETFTMNGPALGTPACQPACQIIDGGTDAGIFDTCQIYAAFQTNCDVDSGICVIPDAGVVSTGGSSSGGSSSGGSTSGGSSSGGTSSGGGHDAGAPDSGPPPAVDSGTPVADAGAPTKSSGCGCSPVSGSPDVLLGVFALVGLLRRRRFGRR
jgi:MYXO-CTERM domain-containing protein